MKKLTLILALISLLGIFAAGCQKDDSSATDKAAAANASDPAKMKAAPAPAGGKATLVAPPPP